MSRATLALLSCLCGLLALTPAARSDQTAPELAPLFEALLEAPDVPSARAVEIKIWEIWLQSPLEHSNTLMERGVAAMGRRDFRTALAIFDELVRESPQFAEAWNKRATVLFLLERYEDSIRDVQETLRLEPRHFGALSGLGLIMLRLGRENEAIAAFEEALAVHPQMPGPRINLELIRAAREEGTI